MRGILPLVAVSIVTTFASAHCPENSVESDQLSACFPTCLQEQDPQVNCMLPGQLGDGCRCKDDYLWNENRTECVHECDCPFGMSCFEICTPLYLSDVFRISKALAQVHCVGILDTD